MSELLDKLKEAGADTEGTLARFMGKEAICEKILKKFPADGSFQAAKAARDAGDDEQAMKMIHTLKGVASNLGLTSIYEITSDMMTKFRADDAAGAYARFDELQTEYDKFIAVFDSI